MLPSINLGNNITDNSKPPAYYAELYKTNGLTGGHVIKLGPGNDQAAREALSAWKDGLQVGGGITPANAKAWLDAGAEKASCFLFAFYSNLTPQVIVTSALFPGGKFKEEVLRELCDSVGKERLVVDIR